jgi:oligopeptide transport system substrate-binding protein
MWKLLLPLLILLGVLGTSIVSDRPLPRADFTFVNRADVTTMDFAQMSWMQDLRAARLVFEGLTRHNVLTRDFRVEPGVAQRWDVSADLKTYTFHLRDNAKWSNGTPVTAEDFRYSWRRLLLPDYSADYTGFFLAIKGGKEFLDWRIEALKNAAPTLARASRAEARAISESLWQETRRKYDELVGVRAPDPRTLVVTLERPVPYFLDLIAFPVFYPVYPPLVSAHESLDLRTGQMVIDPSWTKPPKIIGNGSFVLTRWRFQRDMRFERNPHYWDSKNINVDTIATPSIADENAAVLAFRTGSIDWLTDVTTGYVPEMLRQKREFMAQHEAEITSLRAQGFDEDEIARRLPADPRNTIHAYPAFGTYFWNFNCLPNLRDGRKNPFADPRVRRAFSLAVDKAALVEQVRRRQERPAVALIPPGSIAGYDSPVGLSRDPAEARRLLAEAGYPGGIGFITVEMLFNKDAGHDLVAQFLAKCWREELGISCTYRVVELSIARDDIKNANYVMSRGSWFGDFGDPVTFLDLSRTGDGNNDRKYTNPAYDALLDAAADEIDPAKRFAILRQAEAMMVEQECPILPLFHYNNFYMYDAHKVSGITSHPRTVQTPQIVEIMGDGKGAEKPKRMEQAPPREGLP